MWSLTEVFHANLLQIFVASSMISSPGAWVSQHQDFFSWEKNHRRFSLGQKIELVTVKSHTLTEKRFRKKSPDHPRKEHKLLLILREILSNSNSEKSPGWNSNKVRFLLCTEFMAGKTQGSSVHLLCQSPKSSAQSKWWDEAEPVARQGQSGWTQRWVWNGDSTVDQYVY